LEPISAGLSSLTIPLGTRFDTAIYVAKGDPHLGYRENSAIGGNPSCSISSQPV
jgi:hypothetical protein